MKFSIKDFFSKCEQTRSFLNTSEWGYWRHFGAFIVNFKHILHIILMFSSLTFVLNKHMSVGSYIKYIIYIIRNASSVRIPENTKQKNLHARILFTQWLDSIKQTLTLLLPMHPFSTLWKYQKTLRALGTNALISFKKLWKETIIPKFYRKRFLKTQKSLVLTMELVL